MAFYRKPLVSPSHADKQKNKNTKKYAEGLVPIKRRKQILPNGKADSQQKAIYPPFPSKYNRQREKI